MALITINGGVDENFSDKLNSNFNGVLVKREVHTDDTERTSTSASYVTAGSAFTITEADGIVTGIQFLCKLKSSNGSETVNARLAVTGSTLTTHYIGLNRVTTFGTEVDTPAFGTSAQLNSSDSFTTRNTSYTNMGANVSPGMLMPDATTTFTVEIKAAGGATVSIDDVQIIVTYGIGA